MTGPASSPTRAVAAVLLDSGPVLVLAAIAAAGSFAHIRDTAAEHGQDGWMAWAIAVCIDLVCVMAAREWQRDRKIGRPTAALSWPVLVLAGGIVLSLGANLAQAEPSAWGWVMAGTPAVAFLVAISMLERRATTARLAQSDRPSPDSPAAVATTFGEPSPSALSSLDGPRPELSATGQPSPSESDSGSGPDASLVDFARRAAAEYQAKHGRPITRDALRFRLGVSNQLASELLRTIRDTAA